MDLKFEEMCVFCKSFDMDRQECKRKRVDEKKDPERIRAKVKPSAKPEDLNCSAFARSDDAKFAFGEGGIGYLAETDWAKFKRNTLIKRYKTILFGKGA